MDKRKLEQLEKKLKVDEEPKHEFKFVFGGEPRGKGSLSRFDFDEGDEHATALEERETRDPFEVERLKIMAEIKAIKHELRSLQTEKGLLEKELTDANIPTR
jgi:hypothetical protein